MTYREMVDLANERGHGSETAMHDSVAHIDDMLCMMKKEHPEEFWKFMREQHEILYNGHYSPEFADWDVAKMHSTDRNGKSYHGEHWTKDDVENASEGLSFHDGVTPCDRYVAFNGMWHDLHKEFDDTSIIKIAYLFFFCDEDWEHPATKTWDYFSHK